MAAKRRQNHYKKQAKKKGFLGSISLPAGKTAKAKTAVIETGKDLVIGVLAGGLIGAAIGKPSLLVGIAVTGAGHFTGHNAIRLLGIGMMAANGFQVKSVNGLDGMSIEEVKERLNTYKDSFMDKLYLTKLTGKSTTAAASATAATNGIGELQFFNYPNDLTGAFDELNGELAALDTIERQVEDAGIAQMTGMDMDGLADVSDYNL